MLTNFPQGVSSFGIPIIGSGPILTTGNVFFVNSAAINASNGNEGTSPNKPFATIDYAVRKCTADNGDFILVAPGHTETVATNGGLRLDVAGVTVVGMGGGKVRPTINLTATAAKVVVSAARCSIVNMLFTGGIDAVAAVLSVGANDFSLLSCEYRDVTGQCTVFLITTGFDRLLVKDFVFIGDTAAGNGAAIAINGGSNHEIRNFRISGNFSVGGIDFRTTAATSVWIHDGLIKTYNSADIAIIDTITASTGHIGPNLWLSLTDNAANITEAITGATFRVFDSVYVVNADNEKAMLINWTASTDA